MIIFMEKQHFKVAQRVSCEPTFPVFRSQFYRLLVVWTWAAYLTSLCFSFLVNNGINQSSYPPSST